MTPTPLTKETLPTPEQPNLLDTATDLGNAYFRQLTPEVQKDLRITVRTGKSLLRPDADVTDVYFLGGGISFIHGSDIQSVTVTLNAPNTAGLVDSRQGATTLANALQTLSNQ